VPTVDSVSAVSLIKIVLGTLKVPVLVVGASGTGKSTTILQYCSVFQNQKMVLKKVNFSSATTAGMFQRSIEADVEKSLGKTYAPRAGRWMTVLLDDISMPEVNKWGDQPTLEIVRQIIETKGFYFLDKDRRGDRKSIENLVYIGAMRHPGGVRNDIPSRVKRHFYVFNLTPPHKDAIDNIYGSMMRGRFEHSGPLSDLIPRITKATIELWQTIKHKMLPTPSKFHYIFNMRDVSRVFQGLLSTPLDVISTPEMLMTLWRHECEREFSDKLVSMKDKSFYKKTILEIMRREFGDDVAQFHRELKEDIAFVNFLEDDKIDPDTGELLEETPRIYVLAPSFQLLRQRADIFLNRYNEQVRVKSMHLVLFTDALRHLIRISRIIARPRGNALLVGVGGSGRQSLSRLAAYINGHQIFQIKLTRGYKTADFLDDIRKLYVAVGKEGGTATWIITDFHIIKEEFLEYLNALLTTGEISGLYTSEEKDMMCAELRSAAKKEIPGFVDIPANLYQYFISRIRDNLHVVLWERHLVWCVFCLFFLLSHILAVTRKVWKIINILPTGSKNIFAFFPRHTHTHTLVSYEEEDQNNNNKQTNKRTT